VEKLGTFMCSKATRISLYLEAVCPAPYFSTTHEEPPTHESSMNTEI
jgi:hypothetical protein